jgi:hypothetical protein
MPNFGDRGADERFDRELYTQVLQEERETRQGVLARLRGRE